jgi:dipeptidyl aminopeptidase/acylaminoacyl peptidase
MHHILLPLLVVVLGAASLLGNELTLDQILSSRFPSESVVSPSGKGFTWVVNDRGVRNIWIAQSPQFEARQITSYDLDDGMELTNLQWCLEESAIVYVRGGAPNSSGELPNPLSDTGGVDRELWKVPVSGDPPILINKGYSPLVHPDGRRMAFLEEKTVKLVDVTAADEEGSFESETILTARGSNHSLRWSPDGKRLAFVSARRGRSFVGALSLGSDSVTWMSASIDRDIEPVWSPDSQAIAFIRLPTRSEIFIFAPYREGYPWSIHVADVVTGQGRQIWQADRGRGSIFYRLPIKNQLLWIGDKIVFPWERDGWAHLYAVSTGGGSPRLLTPGEFEVEDVAVGPDQKTIFYSSNQNDLHRRHLWKVSVDAVPIQMTKGSGIEWSPMPLSDGSIGYLASDSRAPADVRMLDANGNTKQIMETKDFPTGLLVEPQSVVFTATDGMEIHGQLFLPTSAKPGDQHPAAIFFHGGSRRQMLLGWHHSSYYHNTYGFNQYLASKGYVVLAVNYRSGIGYGMEFREAENYGATGASEFNDVLGAGLYLKGRPDVDPHRIALWGGSYGGYLAAMGLSRASDLFACGVDIHGVHDWNASIRNFVPSYNPLENPERAEIAFESSPLAHVDTWRSPVLLISGDDDRNVNIHQSIRLTEALRKRSVHVEQLVFPDEVHGFLLHASWKKAFSAAEEFMSRQLTR